MLVQEWHDKTYVTHSHCSISQLAPCDFLCQNYPTGTNHDDFEYNRVVQGKNLMSVSISSSTLEKFTTFGDLLRFLRRRTGLTQTELAAAVGYGHTQISRLEQNLRLPDIPTIEARFVPALELEEEPKVVARLLDLAANIRREDAPALGLCPYKGLNYFDEADADLFVGRELLTAKLVERVLSLASKQQSAEERFLAIVGASGSGKSSLIRAGLVPALRWNQASTDWQIHILTPTAHPLESLALSLTAETDSVTAAATLMDDFAREPRSLQIFVKRKLGLENGSRLLLVVDQFEELFALCRSEEERTAFINNLLAAVSETDGAVILVITLRADFYAHCASYPDLREALAQHQEYIGAMTNEELQRAIEEPAQRGRWEFEPGLVDMLLHDVGHEPGALPLLSHALLETWQRRRGRTMTLSGYASSGGVRGAIAETAETVFTDHFTREQQSIARRIFLRLTELSDETSTADTRRRATFNELILKPEEAATTHAVLKALADARLITTSEDAAEVAHEALIREWPTLRSWLEENREGLRLHRHLTEAAQEWLDMNREPDLLYRGARLAQAREWASLHVSELNELEKEFLQASIESNERGLAEREAQRQRELDLQRQRAEEQSHAAKQLRHRAMWLTSALIIAGVLALAALVFGQRAQQEARLSASRELAAAAISNLEVDPERSILLALQSVSTAHTLEAEDALHKAVFASRAQLTIKAHDAVIGRVTFSPDGSRLASVSQDGVAKIWDVITGEELFALRGHKTGGVNSVAFSPDGKRLATVGDDKTIRVWDATTGQELLTLSGHTDFVVDVVFSPDGKYLASASVDQTAMIWDAEDGRKLFTLRGHMDAIVHVFFSQADNHLMTSSFDGTVKVWDVKTGKELLTLSGLGMAFSSDGTRVATTEDGAMVKISDITTGQQLFTLRGHTNSLTSAAFSRDGKLIATTSLDKKAILWDAITGRELFTLAGHAEAVESVAFSPDTMRLATGDGEGTIKIWDLTPSREVFTIFHPVGNTSWFALNPDGGSLVMTGESDVLPEVWKIPQIEPVEAADSPRKLLTLEGHQGPVRGLTYSRDGSLIASGSFDGTAKVWDVKTGEELDTFAGHKGDVLWVAFSPDGTRLVSAGEDKTIRIWEVKTGKELFVLKRHHLGVLIAVFSPDGTRFATGADDGSAKIWDTASGKEIFSLTHPGTVFGVAFSPDGRRLATASNTEIVKVWDALSGKELFHFSGHTSSIVSIAFSPDGKRLATASRDGTAKLWDATSGEELLTLYGSGAGICCVAFTPDAKYLFTGGDDGVRVYTLQMEDLVALARSRLTRSLTKAECQKYLRRESCPAQE